MLPALWCHEQLPAAVQFAETNLPFDIFQSNIYFRKHTWLTTFFWVYLVLNIYIVLEKAFKFHQNTEVF